MRIINTKEFIFLVIYRFLNENICTRIDVMLIGNNNISEKINAFYKL